MLTPFLLHRCYTEQNMNCFKIGCFSFEERLGVHMKITQAAHNPRKTVGVVSGDLGSGGGCQKRWTIASSKACATIPPVAGIKRANQGFSGSVDPAA